MLVSFVLDGVEKWWLTLKFVGSVVGHVFKYAFVFNNGVFRWIPVVCFSGMPVVSHFWLYDYCLKEQEEKHKEVATECTQLKASYSSIWGVPKIVGFPPQIIHFDRVFHYFHHPFWGTPIFGNPHIPKKVGRPSFFVKIILHDWGRRPNIQAGTKTPWDTGWFHHGFTMVWPWHALQNLRQELKNEQSRSSEVSAKLEELEATQEKNRWGFSCVFLQGVLRTFVFASFFGMLCISIKCFVQILKWWNEDEMYSQYDEDLVDKNL